MVLEFCAKQYSARFDHTNSRSAWPIVILMPFLGFSEHAESLRQDAYNIFETVLKSLSQRTKYSNFWFGV